MKRRLRALVPWAVAVVAVGFLWQRGSQWQRLQPFVGASSSHERAVSPYSSAQEYRQSDAELKVLRGLWLQRRQRNIAPRVRSFVLKHPPVVQFRAARVLGHLEDAASLPALQQLRRGQPRSGKGKEQGLFFPRLDIAVGKISARHLRGGAKLERISREIGLSWADVAALSTYISHDTGNSGPSHGPRDHTARAGDVMDEMLDVLAKMARDGDDPSRYAQQMSLDAAQRLYLRASAMEDAKGLPLLLEHLTRSRIIGTSLLWLEGRVIQAEPKALSRALQTQLRKMNQFQSRYPYPSGYDVMCKICVATLDRSCLPLLEKLRGHPDRRVVDDVDGAIYDIKKGHRSYYSYP